MILMDRSAEKENEEGTHLHQANLQRAPSGTEFDRSGLMEATLGMVDGIRSFNNRDNVKALMSVGEAWRSANNDSARASQKQGLLLKIGDCEQQRAHVKQVMRQQKPRMA